MLYTFYGDDFTGSTDVLEQLASNGVPAVLFLRPPTPADLAAFPNIQALGIAGDSLAPGRPGHHPLHRPRTTRIPGPRRRPRHLPRNPRPRAPHPHRRHPAPHPPHPLLRRRHLLPRRPAARPPRPHLARQPPARSPPLPRPRRRPTRRPAARPQKRPGRHRRLLRRRPQRLAFTRLVHARLRKSFLEGPTSRSS
jgi:hypothetical protein